MRLRIATILILMIFVFQNCTKSSLSSSNSKTPVNQSDVAVEVNLAKEELKNISFKIESLQTLNKAGHTYTLKTNNTLFVDLITGDLVSTSEIDGVVNNFCLSDDFKAELIGILKNSQICRSQPLVSPDTACAESLRPAYAELAIVGEKFGLGSASDSCGRNAVDLCEGRSELLKVYISKLDSQYEQFTCIKSD